MFWREDLFEEMQRMQKEMDLLFQKAFADETQRHLLDYNGQKLPENTSAGKSVQQWRVPKTYISETESSVIASFELPGVDKESIELNVLPNSIQLSVEKKQENEHKDKKRGTYKYFSQSSSFYRQIPLSVEVKADEAKAEYKNGMLRVEIPKRKEGKAHKVEISGF